MIWNIVRNPFAFTHHGRKLKHSFNWTLTQNMSGLIPWHLTNVASSVLRTITHKYININIYIFLNQTVYISLIIIFIYIPNQPFTHRHPQSHLHHPTPLTSKHHPQHPLCLYALGPAPSVCENFIAHYMLEHDEMTDDLLGPKKCLGCGHFYLHAVAACQLFSSRTGNNTGSLN